MKEAIIKKFSKASIFNRLASTINLEWIDAKFVFLLQILTFGTILFFLPLEYPTFHVRFDMQFHHAFKGFWTTFLNEQLSTFPSDILIFTIALFTLHKWREKLISDSPKYLVIFLISIIITIFSNNLTIANGFNHKFYAILGMTLLFSFTHYFLEKNAKAKLHFFFLIILLMSIFQGVLGSIQYFTQAPAGLPKFETFSLFASIFNMPIKKLWLIDNIFSVTRNSDTIARAYGTLTHANVYGGFMLFSSFITYYFFYIVKNRLIEILLGLIILFQFFSLSLSFSRAAIIGYVIGAALWFFLLFLKKMKEYKQKKKLLRLALWVGFSLLICFVLFYEQFINRGGIINYNQFVSISSDLPRWKSLLVSLKIIQDHPFFGVGLENSQNFIPSASIAVGLGNSFICVTHNIYVLIIVETGLIGACFFFLFIGSILKKALAVLTPLSLSLLCTFSGLLFVGCCDFYLWRFPSGRLMFFITAGMISGLSNFLIKKSQANDSVKYSSDRSNGICTIKKNI